MSVKDTIANLVVMNSRVDKEEKERYGGIWREEEENADYGGIVQPSQQHTALCVKVVEWELGSKFLRMVASFWTSSQFFSALTLEVTQEVDVVPRHATAGINQSQMPIHSTKK